MDAECEMCLLEGRSEPATVLWSLGRAVPAVKLCAAHALELADE